MRQEGAACKAKSVGARLALVRALALALALCICSICWGWPVLTVRGGC